MSSFLQRTAIRLVPVPGPASPGQEEEIRVKDLRVELQTRSNWCWAAVVSAVARHYDPATRYAQQCAVAAEHLKRTLSTPAEQQAAGVGLCCANRRTCNLEASLDEVLETVGLAGEVRDDCLEFDELWTELPGLLCARIEYPLERGHFVAIAGATRQGGERQVIVADPTIDAPYACPYEVFRDKYLGDGMWTTTYWTQRDGHGAHP